MFLSIDQQAFPARRCEGAVEEKRVGISARMLSCRYMCISKVLSIIIAMMIIIIIVCVCVGGGSAVCFIIPSMVMLHHNLQPVEGQPDCQL